MRKRNREKKSIKKSEDGKENENTKRKGSRDMERELEEKVDLESSERRQRNIIRWVRKVEQDKIDKK